MDFAILSLNKHKYIANRNKNKPCPISPNITPNKNGKKKEYNFQGNLLMEFELLEGKEKKKKIIVQNIQFIYFIIMKKMKNLIMNVINFF